MMIAELSKYVSGWRPAWWMTSGKIVTKVLYAQAALVPRPPGCPCSSSRGGRPGGRDVEAPPAQAWMNVAGRRASQLRVVIGTLACGQNRTSIRPAATAIETLAWIRSWWRSALGPARRGRPRGRPSARFGPDVVAGRLDGRDQLQRPGDGRVDGHRGPLRGQVDVGLEDAVGLVQEALDAVDARGAGHPLDRQDDLDRGAGIHTPRQYATPILPGGIGRAVQRWYVGWIEGRNRIARCARRGSLCTPRHGTPDQHRRLGDPSSRVAGRTNVRPVARFSAGSCASPRPSPACLTPPARRSTRRCRRPSGSG
jgi:hypothetical protein